MNPGLYVVRRTRHALVLESRQLDPSIAETWGEFIKDEHPKDRVFLIEVKHEIIHDPKDQTEMSVRSGETGIS